MKMKYCDKYLGFCLVLLVLIACFIPAAYGRVIHIPKDYDTVQEGIDESEEGDTVLVSPGTYYENIRMKDGITLEGVDVETTILADDGEGPPDPIVELSCSCTLKNLTITGARGAGVGHAVVVLKGNPKVLNNVIKDNNYTGLGIHSEVDQVRAYVEGNRIYGNGGAGMSNLGSGVDNLIVNNYIYNNNNLGVVALDSGTIRLKNNEIRGNGVGVVSKTGGKAYIEDNLIENNKTVGIVVKEKAFAEITHNRLIKNGTPGMNVDNGTANLYKNEIRDNGTIGIYYKNKSKGLLEDNEISGIIPNLIIVQDSELTLNKNKIFGSPGMKNTITIKKSKVTFSNNEIVGGVKTDEDSKIEVTKKPGKGLGFGCLGLF